MNDKKTTPVLVGQEGRGSKFRRILLPILGVLFPPLGFISAASFFVKAKKDKNATLYFKGITIIILAVVMLLGYAAVYQRLTTQPYKYTYNVLDNYTLSNGKSSVTMQKPKEFIQHEVKSIGKNKGATLDTSGNSKDPSGVMFINVIAEQTTNQDYFNMLNKTLKTASGSSYDNYLKAYRDYLKNFVPDGYKLTLANPIPFTNKKITSNAWQFNFLIRRVNNVPLWGKTENLDVKGKMILIFNNSATYYVAVRDGATVWQSNQAVWTKIFDSLEVK